MNHPFTTHYISMVSASAEAQQVRMKSKVFEAGDYVIFESAFTPAGMVSMIDERSGGIIQDNALSWLPQLHQLMALFGNYPASLQAIRSGLGFPGAGAPSGYYEAFRSWEECTLAVLMLQRCQKVWMGREWSPAPLPLKPPDRPQGP